MKIARITVHRVDIPFAEGVYTLSGGRTYELFDSTIVSVETDDGVTCPESGFANLGASRAG